jgi:hypothetical protein
MTDELPDYSRMVAECGSAADDLNTLVQIWLPFAKGAANDA